MKKQKLNIIHDKNRSNTIDDIIKSYEDLSTPTTIPQSVRERDDKARTLVPKYNEKSNRLKNLEKEYKNTTKEKNIDSTTLENSKFYEHELNISDSKKTPKMLAKKIDIINRLKTLYTFRKIKLEDKINDLKNKKTELKSNR